MEISDSETSDEGGYDIRSVKRSDSLGSVSNRKYVFIGTCSEILQKLIAVQSHRMPLDNQAIFVPESLYEKYKKTFFIEKLFVTDDHVWDYNLKIGDTIEPMKLIWITRVTVRDYHFRTLYYLNIKNAFLFLRPGFLRYLDKPFSNRDCITQVNIILDYHRTQKRRRGIEIFNICDLINFKMAIDDNRYEYENCEFHKIIDSTLAEHINNNMYMENGRFNFVKYLNGRKPYYYSTLGAIFEYMIYHFQGTIGSVVFFQDYIDIIKLTNITNIPLFLKSVIADFGIPIKVTDTDVSGNCSEVLYELLTKDVVLKFEFEMDEKWLYSGQMELNETIKSVARSLIFITTPNRFNFIENFINWLKLSFGKHTGHIDLIINSFNAINAYIFNDFYINHLTLYECSLNSKLCRMLKLCKYRHITFYNCRIQADLNERFDLIGRQSKKTKNIFGYLEELHNVELIKLHLNKHTIGMLIAYVASVMAENNLMQFKFKHKLKFLRGQRSNIFEFRRFYVNSVVDQIEAYTKSGERYDYYAEFVNVEESDREEFDFYQ